jgi:acetyl esterase/lipase
VIFSMALSMYRCPMVRLIIFLIFGYTAVLPVMAEDAEVVTLWPESVPVWGGPEGAEHDATKSDDGLVAGQRVMRKTNVSVPQLHVYLADDDPDTPFVIICPGGGYHILAWDLEGTEIATWLQSIGVNAGVLKYRVPSAGEPIRHLAPVQDAQRAISLVREKYASGNTKIGLLGFSAGAYTVIRTAAATQPLYGEATSAAPKADFCALIYPAYLINQASGEFTKDFEVSKEFPPTFFAHAADDVYVSAGSVQLHQRILDAGTPSELHVFATGGHGFGGRVAGSPTDAWRSLCETWMRSQSIIAIAKQDDENP